MQTEFSNLTIAAAGKRLAAGEVTSEALVQASLKAIAQKNPELNAVVSTYESALEDARAMDKRRAEGADLGPLAGIPMLVKDNMLVAGQCASAGSRILENYKAAYDSTVVSRLKKAGAILIGRANMDEFAMGSSTETSFHGPTRNPWDMSRVPGGSSGGSAAAVAAGFVSAALGSDTGGSVRQPASLCGVVGLKPTYGRVSRYGLMAMASSLDQIGPLTHTVEDAALVMQAIEGADAKDATTVQLPDTFIPALETMDVKGLRIGLPKEFFVKGMDTHIKTAVMNAVAEWESAGAMVREISLPHTKFALAAYYVNMPAEVSANLERFDGIRYGYSAAGETLLDTYERTRAEGFGAEAKRRIILGTYVLSAGYYDAYYRKAMKVRTLIKRDFEEAFKDVDVIAGPTSPSIAWKLGEKFDDPLTMYLSDIYTISANLASVPAMSLPCGFASVQGGSPLDRRAGASGGNGLPIGLQLHARPFGEADLYRAGMYFQSRTTWHLQTPTPPNLPLERG